MPLTSNHVDEPCPKALLPIANKPMLDYPLAWLEKSGVTGSVPTRRCSMYDNHVLQMYCLSAPHLMARRCLITSNRMCRASSLPFASICKHTRSHKIWPSGPALCFGILPLASKLISLSSLATSFHHPHFPSHLIRFIISQTHLQLCKKLLKATVQRMHWSSSPAVD